MSHAWLDPDETARALGYLEETFGIPPEAFADHRLLRRGDSIYALRRDAEGACTAYNWLGAGLKLLRVTGSGEPRASTRGLQIFGRLATRRVWDADAESLRALVSGRSLPWSGERGFVLLRWKGAPVGLAVTRGEQIVAQFTRSVTENLRLEEGVEPL